MTLVKYAWPRNRKAVRVNAKTSQEIQIAFQAVDVIGCGICSCTVKNFAWNITEVFPDGSSSSVTGSFNLIYRTN
jgi:hypothetical protein